MDGLLVNLAPVLFIFAVFYFLIIRPQQAKANQHLALIKSVKVGDDVLLSSGLYGKISSYEEKDTFCLIEISKGIDIKIEKNEIDRKIS